MDRCCLCNEIINPPAQNMRHKGYWVCATCVSKGKWEQLRDGKTELEYPNNKRN